MEDEQAKILEVLQLAIQMEVDGKKYYLKSSRESSNKVGKELFQSLAVEEDDHRQRFEEIYRAIKDKKAWPEVGLKLEGGQKSSTLFAQAMKTASPDVKVPSTELNAVAKAIDMENKSYEFYRAQGSKAVYDAERDFYRALAEEEREHYLSLVDYREYLADPVGWFRQKERPSLDGG